MFLQLFKGTQAGTGTAPIDGKKGGLVKLLPGRRNLKEMEKAACCSLNSYLVYFETCQQQPFEAVSGGLSLTLGL